MRDRIFRILNILKDTETDWVSDFKEEDNRSFELITPYSEHEHRTWLEYEPTQDGEIVRMRLTHLFGYLNLEDSSDSNELIVLSNQLFDLLKENNPQYRGSSAYLGLAYRDGYYFVSLHAAPIFLTKWDDDEIAEVLNMQVFDLIMSLAFVPPKPIISFSMQRAIEMDL